MIARFGLLDGLWSVCANYCLELGSSTGNHEALIIQHFSCSIALSWQKPLLGHDSCKKMSRAKLEIHT